MKLVTFLRLTASLHLLLSATCGIAAGTADDFIRSPASLQYFVQEATIVGTGNIVTEAAVEGEKAILISGDVIIRHALIPKGLQTPMSIHFQRKSLITPFVADPVWNSVAPEKMNGLNVLIFASGSSQNPLLIGLISLDNPPPNFINDLTTIFQEASFGNSDLTAKVFSEHPVLSSYVMRSIFCRAEDWSNKLAIAKEAFAQNNPLLSESVFHEAMLSLCKRPNVSPEVGTQLIELALENLKSSSGQSLANELASLENIGAESIASRSDWSKLTLNALLEKERSPLNSLQELKLLRRVAERIVPKN